MRQGKKITSLLLISALILGLCATGTGKEAKAAEPEEAVMTSDFAEITEPDTEDADITEELQEPEEMQEAVESEAPENVPEAEKDVAGEPGEDNSVGAEAVSDDREEISVGMQGQQPIATAGASSFSYTDFDTKVQYVIKNVYSGCYLNIPGNSSKRVARITIWTADNSNGQKFTLTKNTSGWYTMTPVCAPSMRVNIEGEHAGQDIRVGTYANTNHSTQGWYFEPVKGGYVIRSAENPEYVLDICGKAKGKEVKVKKCDTASCPGQVWTIQKYVAPKSTLAATFKLGASSYVVKKTNKVIGTIKSNYNLTQVTVSVDGTKLSKTVKLNTTDYTLPSAFTTAMQFNKWKGGKTFTVRLTAKDASGKTVVKTAKCTVRKSSLAISSKIGSAKITAGSMNGVSGKVTSNKKISKVVAKIIGKGNKKTYFSKTVKPKKTSCKLTGKIDKAMKFNKLKAGTYLLVVTAWDTAGSKVSQSLECTVLKSNSNVSSKKNGTLGVPYYSQDDKRWCAVKIGNSSSNIGQVNGKSGYGCTLTCVAMIEQYKNVNKTITPATVARTKGQFQGDLFIWGGVYGKNYVKTGTSLTNIYNMLRKKRPVMVSVSKKGEGQHWVVVYGYKNVKVNKKGKPKSLKLSNFLIRDPGWSGRTYLSSYDSVKVAYYRK